MKKEESFPIDGNARGAKVWLQSGGSMRKQASFLLLGALSFLPTSVAKDKTKDLLPGYILQAKTVAVLIDPDAGVDVTAPEANRTAQKDVETALLHWGRFEPVIDSSTADLLIVVRKGNGKNVNATIPDTQQNRRPGVVNGTDTSILIGGQRGKQPNTPGEPDASLPGGPHPKTEIGEAADSFLVYEGQQKDALDTSPGWRFVAKDALHSHDVPAVDAFRKAIADAEKKSAKP
jgi:hypothetical protein